ncbi:MAG TPA: ArsR family transcriptional regulator [Kouleothrix sp.]|uniref:helix-turn-helix transcriptional regulator n=1 Tax=Kouleothrix sp. TaxID=2779161 RepID=UPI002C64C87E|nr:ArsR family transcriptional regulator [Kouleothrix sp.]HRC75401.1 ArsR family transcriptional regulator [Kouleothrix sp.]
MTPEHREQGETRLQIVQLLRRHGQMTAAELSDALGIGAVGIRQHLAMLDRDGLVCTTGVRRGVGRPSHLYGLTSQADTLFPKRYDRLAMDALAFVEAQGGVAAIDQLFEARRLQLARQLAPRLAGKARAEQVAELAAALTEQGYMCEFQHHADGSYTLTEHNCPVDCVARDYPQACEHELKLYEDVLGTPLVREDLIAEGGTCCRYRIGPG